MAVTFNSTSADGLTVRATVKTELEISSSADDAFIDTLIDQASDAIVTYTGRTFHRVTVTETRAGHGRPRMLLTHTPVQSVSSVTLDGSTVSSTAYSIDDPDAGVLWRDIGWDRTTLYLDFVETTPTGDGDRDWSIQYIAGYVTPEEAASTGSTLGERTLPHDVERACIDTVKSMYLRRSEDSRIKRQAVDETSEVVNNTTALPPSAEALLQRWRRIDLGAS